MSDVEHRLTQAAQSFELGTLPDVGQLMARGRRRRGTKRAGLALLVVTLVAGACGGVVVLEPDGSDVVTTSLTDVPPADRTGSGVGVVVGVAVPGVVGLSLSDAVAGLDAVGLVGAVDDGDPGLDASIVIAQAPGSGVESRPGGVIGFRTALPDPPAAWECAGSQHPRDAELPDALPVVDGVSRANAEAAVETMREQEGGDVFLGQWNRYARQDTASGKTEVVAATGYQVIAIAEGAACPLDAPDFVGGVPVTNVRGPLTAFGTALREPAGGAERPEVRIEGRLPTGDRYLVVSRPPLERTVEGISAPIVIDLPDSDPPMEGRALGIAFFERSTSRTPLGADASRGRVIVRSGDWHLRVELYDDVVSALGDSAAEIVLGSIVPSTASSESRLPAFELRPPLRWAEDYELPDLMMVQYPNFIVRRGCSDLAAACSPDGSLEVVPGEHIWAPADPWPNNDVQITAQ